MASQNSRAHPPQAPAVNSMGLMAPMSPQSSAFPSSQRPPSGNSTGVMTPMTAQSSPQKQPQTDLLLQNSQASSSDFMTPDLSSEGEYAAIIRPTQLPAQNVGSAPLPMEPGMGSGIPKKTHNLADRPTRKLPPPPRPASGPKRNPGVKPQTSPPPRPNIAPPSKPSSKPGATGVSLIGPPQTSPTKPAPPVKPGNLIGTGQPVATTGNAKPMVSLLDDPFDLIGMSESTSKSGSGGVFGNQGAANQTSPTKPIPAAKPTMLGPSSNISANVGNSFAGPLKHESPVSKEEGPEPVYAAVVKKGKAQNDLLTSPSEQVVAPPTANNSLLDMFDTKPDVTNAPTQNPAKSDASPPPLPATRPPLEDFEDLLTPAEMTSAMNDRNKVSSSLSNDFEEISLFGPSSTS